MDYVPDSGAFKAQVLQCPPELPSAARRSAVTCCATTTRPQMVSRWRQRRGDVVEGVGAWHGVAWCRGGVRCDGEAAWRHGG